MLDAKTLTALALKLAQHQGVTHWAISMQILKKGDFFHNIMEKNYDARGKTLRKVADWFSDNWPDSLDWPADIPRPTPSCKKDAA